MFHMSCVFWWECMYLLRFRLIVWVILLNSDILDHFNSNCGTKGRNRLDEQKWMIHQIRSFLVISCDHQIVEH